MPSDFYSPQLTLLLYWIVSVSALGADIILHDFSGGSDGGYPGDTALTVFTTPAQTFPFGTEIPAVTALYGVAGANIFSIQANGTSYSVVASLSNFPTPGYFSGGVVVRAETSPLYRGAAPHYYGVSNGGGFGFRVQGSRVYSLPATFGSSSALHIFAGSPGDGAVPLGRLTLVDATLYGITVSGGANIPPGYSSGVGTLYKVGLDGSGYQILHQFGAEGDGQQPEGSLTFAEGSLYGTTPYGGALQHSGTFSFGSSGSIFKIGTDGSGYTLLHSFPADGSEGSRPTGSVLLDGGRIYGMTRDGGTHNAGTVFSMAEDGSNFSILRSFSGGATDGSLPWVGGLTKVGGKLFGTTLAGGVGDLGTVFEINTDGTDFALLHSFTGGTTDGAQPMGTLTYLDGTLFGVANIGGAAGYGTIFAVQAPEPGSGVLLSLGVFSALLRRPRKQCRE